MLWIWFNIFREFLLQNCPQNTDHHTLQQQVANAPEYWQAMEVST